jgi:hypothetical protein
MVLSLILAAAVSQSPGQDMACSYSVRDQEQLKTRTVQDGLTVTVRRKPDPGLVEDACVVEVRDASGRVVFAREGYNTKLHGDSGRDVDNDGAPDLIVGYDTGGGNQCCWEYAILSFRPAIHVAGTFADPSFTIDVNRRTVVWSMLPFSDLGPAMGQSPTLAIAEQYRDGRFVEMTSEYCPAILAGSAPGLANLSQDLWQLEGSRRAASREEREPPSFEVESTRASATTVALQMMYCGQNADAHELIRQVWPEAEQNKVRADIEAAVAATRKRRGPNEPRPPGAPR